MAACKSLRSKIILIRNRNKIFGKKVLDFCTKRFYKGFSFINYLNMDWIEKLILGHRIKKGRLKLYDFKWLCEAYCAREKGSEELLAKLFVKGNLTDAMMDYLHDKAGWSTRRLYTTCTGKSI